MNQNLAQRRFEEASERFKNRDYTGALVILDELHGAFPKNREITFARARCLAALGRRNDALDLCSVLAGRLGDARGTSLAAQIRRGNADSPQVAQGRSEGSSRRSILLIGAAAATVAVLAGAIVWLLMAEPEPVPPPQPQTAEVAPEQREAPIPDREATPLEEPAPTTEAPPQPAAPPPRPPDVEPVQLVSPRRYRVEHTVTLKPKNGKPFDRATIQVPVPVQQRHQQVVDLPLIRIEPTMSDFVGFDKQRPNFGIVPTKPFDALLVFVALGKTPEPQKYTIDLKYAVEVWNMRIDRDQLDEVPFKRLDELDESIAVYLKPEVLAESEHREIKSVVLDLFPSGIDEAASIAGVAERIYNWVLDRCSYQKNKGRGRKEKLWGALDLLKTRKGECGDYTALFVAVCRAAGIPARAQAGFLTDKVSERHVWAEFYVPGFEWVPVDPSMGDQSRRELYFVNLPGLNRRISVTHGFDHVFEGKRLNYLQDYSFHYYYRGQPVSYEADYRFVARRS